MLDTSLTAAALAHSDFMVLIPTMAVGPLHLQRTVPIQVLALHVTHHVMVAEVRGDKSVGAERCMHQPWTNSLPAKYHMCATIHGSIRQLCSSALTEHWGGASGLKAYAQEVPAKTHMGTISQDAVTVG